MRIAVAGKILCMSAIVGLALSTSARAAAPSAEEALKFTPLQPGVDYDRPRPEDFAKCKIKLMDGRRWVVESPDGVVLREFVDTNGDKRVDQWSYYKDGLEVYRDIDSDYNGKPDQCRWFHTAGSRWGLENEDGVIVSWKSISAEEAAAEVVAAIATQDVDRFARLILTPDELKSLGLGKSRLEAVNEKIGKLVGGFKAMASRQKTVSPQSAWVQFSAGRPGIVPAGTDGSTKDIRVYENATAIVETAGKHGQVQIGTLIQVGDVWRLIDMPQPVVEGQASTAQSGFFFQASTPLHDERTAAAGPSDAFQKLLGELEILDRESGKSPATTPAEQATVTTKRAALLEQIAAAAKNAEDRAVWIRQLADMILAAVQSGGYPDGAQRLAALLEKLRTNDADKNLAAYVKLRQLTAAYALSWQAPKADFSKIQAEWLKNLEQYIGDYPAASETAEAMLQLASAQELSGQDAEAKKWYVRIAKDFPDSPAARKANGAQVRLESVGKIITLAGKSSKGGSVDLEELRGKIVLIQYWATWCVPAKADMATLKELANKYGRSFAIIGVSLDSNVKELNAYLAENPLPWSQIYEEGGLDSRPANALGILTVPTMILVDREGKVVSRNVSIAELETELKRLVR
jgi:thiol-disulfide isomerase/thioredoxin